MHCVSFQSSVSTPPAPTVMSQPSGADLRMLTSTSATIPVTVCSTKNSAMSDGIALRAAVSCSGSRSPTATAPASLLWASPRPFSVMGKPMR